MLHRPSATDWMVHRLLGGATHPVHLKRSSDQQQAGRQLPQEDDTPALEAASQQDQHCAWGDAAAKLGRLSCAAPPERFLHIICWVVFWSLRIPTIR